MSNDKKGVQIIETDEFISILAKADFSISSSYSKKILAKIEEKENKRLRINLSSGGKFFSDTLFRIRQAIIDKGWEDAAVRVNSKRDFAQRVFQNGDVYINTMAYEATLRGADLRMSLQGKLFPYDDCTREIVHLIRCSAPRSLNIVFPKVKPEKVEIAQKNRVDLQNYFIHSLQEIRCVEDISFYTGPDLVAFFSRSPDEDTNVAQPEQPVQPVVKSKHIDQAPTDDKENTKE